MITGVRVAIGSLFLASLFGADLARLSAHPPAASPRPVTPAGVPAQSPSPFRSQTDLVALYVTVTDSAGRLLTGLTKDDFTLLDQGKVQEISVFSTEPQPLSLVVMLDYSGSTRQHRHTIGQAAGRLVDRLLPEDRARVGAFPDGSGGLFRTSRVLFSPPAFTSSREQLTAALIAQAESIEGSGSPIWEAADRSLDALAVETSRRVLVLFSDGHDNQSGSRFERVLKRVREMPAWAYTVGFALIGNAMPATVAPRAPSLVNTRTPPIEVRAERANTPGNARAEGASLHETMERALAAVAPSPPPNPRPTGAAVNRPPAPTTIAPEPRLRDLALASGGRYFEASGSSDFAAIFAEIIDELHSQYLLGFVPAVLDGTTHRIEVTLRVSGASVHTRPTYVAGRR